MNTSYLYIYIYNHIYVCIHECVKYWLQYSTKNVHACSRLHTVTRLFRDSRGIPARELLGQDRPGAVPAHCHSDAFLLHKGHPHVAESRVADLPLSLRLAQDDPEEEELRRKKKLCPQLAHDIRPTSFR